MTRKTEQKLYRITIRVLTSRLLILLLSTLLVCMSALFSLYQNSRIVTYLEAQSASEADTLVNTLETNWRNINRAIESITYRDTAGSRLALEDWVTDSDILINAITGLDTLAVVDPELNLLVAVTSETGPGDTKIDLESYTRQLKYHTSFNPSYRGNTLTGFIFSAIDLEEFVSPYTVTLQERFSLSITSRGETIYEHGDWIPFNAMERFTSRRAANFQNDRTLQITLIPTRSYIRSERMQALNNFLVMLLLTCCIVTALYLAQKNYRLSQLSEHRFRNLLENVQLAAINIDLTGTIIFCNDYFLSQTGWERKEIVGRHGLPVFLDPANRHIHELYLDMLGGKLFMPNTEVPITARSGKKLWFAFNNTLLRDVRGIIIGISILGADITGRRAAEAALNLQSSALNAAANAILITDTSGTILWCNTAYCELTGYAIEETLGHNPRDLIKSGVHNDTFYEHIWKTILSGRVWRGEFTNKRRDGTLYPEAETITPVKDNQGVITHFVAVKEDISEHKAMLEENQRLSNQIHQSRKMESLGQLAGGIAHDFNNLLMPIIGYAEMGKTDIESADQLDTVRQSLLGSFTQILKAAERAATLTRQILAFSRRQVLTLQPLQLNNVITEFSDMLTRVTRENVEIRLDLDPQLKTIEADSGQMEQVLLNLVINATDAMPEGGQILICTRNVRFDSAANPAAILPTKTRPNSEDSHQATTHNALPPPLAATDSPIISGSTLPAGEYTLLEISDTGSGIAPEHLSNIFDPFFTTKPRGSGTGLGLSTVFGIVQQHKGSIWLLSELQAGATFYCLFPAVDRALRELRKQTNESKPKVSETILVVDDAAVVLQMIQDTLTSYGYKVYAADTASTALQLFEQHKDEIDLLISDVIMPEMHGPEIYYRIQATSPDIPVLFISGYADGFTLEEVRSMESVSFLQKPFTVRNLIRMVRNILGASDK